MWLYIKIIYVCVLIEVRYIRVILFVYKIVNLYYGIVN